MNIWEPLIIALSQLRANKLRSFLSLSGILIAVGSVIGVLALGDGLRNAIVGEFDRMGGTSSIFSWAPDSWYRDSQGRWVRRNWEEYLTNEDISAILAATDKVEYIVPHVHVGGEGWNIVYRTVSAAGGIVCTMPLYFSGENWNIASGRVLSALDIASNAKVCVLGAQMAEDLFGSGVDPVGKEVNIGKMRFTVVGVMERKEFFDNDYDTRTIIPITTAQHRIIGNDRMNWIRVKVKRAEDVPEVVATMKRVYKSRHQHGEDYGIQTGEAALQEVNKIILIMKIVAGSVAGISLLVGGIGIMNIMLVSVTERTREIGIRMAMGAKRRNILRQFIIEAFVLCMIGGFLGILLGIGIGTGTAAFIESKSNWVFASVVSMKMMVFAVGFSVAVGLIFGVYPAWRASRLSPVEALRME